MKQEVSRHRVTRALNAWAAEIIANRTPVRRPGIYGRQVVLSPATVRFCKEAGLDTVQYARSVYDEIKSGKLPKDFLSRDPYKWPAKRRASVRNPITGTWTKRNDKSGKFVEVKTSARRFNGSRAER